MIYLVYLVFSLLCLKYWIYGIILVISNYEFKSFGKMFIFIVVEVINDGVLDIKYNYNCMWVLGIKFFDD